MARNKDYTFNSSKSWKPLKIEMFAEEKRRI